MSKTVNINEYSFKHVRTCLAWTFFAYECKRME